MKNIFMSALYIMSIAENQQLQILVVCVIHTLLYHLPLEVILWRLT